MELWIGTETEPSRHWSIAVSGGTPSTNVMEVTDQYSHEFTVAVAGEVATVTMTLEPAPGWELNPDAHCYESTTGLPEEVAFRVAPPQLILEVEPGGRYSCAYHSSRVRAGNLTAPPTDTRAAESPGPGVPWLPNGAVMASVVAALFLLAVRSGGKHSGKRAKVH